MAGSEADVLDEKRLVIKLRGLLPHGPFQSMPHFQPCLPVPTLDDRLTMEICIMLISMRINTK